MEYFWWDLEYYFITANVPEANKLTMVLCYFRRDAIKWWTKHVDDESSNQRKIHRLERLKTTQIHSGICEDIQ